MSEEIDISAKDHIEIQQLVFKVPQHASFLFWCGVLLLLCVVLVDILAQANMPPLVLKSSIALLSSMLSCQHSVYL